MRATSISSRSRWPRQQRGAAPEGHRCVLHPELVQQPRVGELPGEVSPADHPQILATRRVEHRAVDVEDVGTRHADISPLRHREITMRQHPRGLRVRPAALLMAHDPLERGCPHHQRADALLKAGVRHRTVHVDVLAQQPVQGMLGSGDEAVQAGRGEVVSGHTRMLARAADIAVSPPAGRRRPRVASPTPAPGSA